MSNELTKVALLQSDKAKPEQISTKEVKAMVRETVALAGGLDFIKDGQSVVLKPNIISTRTSTGQLKPMAMAMPFSNAYRPGTEIIPQEVNGLTSDYRIAQELVTMIREVNPTGKIMIMESSGDGSTTKNLELMGYTSENLPEVDEIISLDDTGEKFRGTDSDDIVGVTYNKRLYKKMSSFMKEKYYFNKTYWEADVVISLTCLKNHQNVAYTGGIKNLGIGVMPQQVYRNSRYSNVNRGLAIDHSFGPLSDWIHDYYLLKPADFVFVDGLQGLAYGPACQGAPDYDAAKMNMRCMMASKDAVANDSIGCLLVGVDPAKIPYLETIAKDGEGESDLSKIQVVGNVRVDQLKKKFPRPEGLLGRIFAIPEGVVYEDYAAPQFRLEEVQIKDGRMTADVSAEEKVIKIELYDAEGNLVAVEGNSKQMDVPFTGESGYAVAYDQLLNATKIEF